MLHLRLRVEVLYGPKGGGTISIFSPRLADLSLSEDILREIKECVERLDSPYQDSAVRRLKEIGYPAYELLKEAVGSKDAEFQERVSKLLRTLKSEQVEIDMAKTQNGR